MGWAAEEGQLGENSGHGAAPGEGLRAVAGGLEGRRPLLSALKGSVTERRAVVQVGARTETQVVRLRGLAA